MDMGEAVKVIEEDYVRDVRTVAGSVRDEINNENITKCDQLYEAVEEEVNQQAYANVFEWAVLTLRLSSNRHIAVENGFVMNGGITLEEYVLIVANQAFREDVLEELKSQGYDFNDLHPAPCGDCENWPCICHNCSNCGEHEECCSCEMCPSCSELKSEGCSCEDDPGEPDVDDSPSEEKSEGKATWYEED